jgi:hypothetical protein
VAVVVGVIVVEGLTVGVTRLSARGCVLTKALGVARSILTTADFFCDESLVRTRIKGGKENTRDL